MPPTSSGFPFQSISEFRGYLKSTFSEHMFPIPKNATNTVYVEGIPIDATEREVSHMFRPFLGFKTVRLIPREKRPGEKVVLCFADFETVI